MGKIEGELGQIRKYLADLELLTFQHGKTNPHSFCLDEVDHKIMEYLMHYKSATTPELAEYLKTNRWLVLNRLEANPENLQGNRRENQSSSTMRGNGQARRRHGG